MDTRYFEVVSKRTKTTFRSKRYTKLGDFVMEDISWCTSTQDNIQKIYSIQSRVWRYKVTVKEQEQTQVPNVIPLIPSDEESDIRKTEIVGPVEQGLRAAYEIIKDRNNWITGDYASIDGTGHSRFCAVGAITHTMTGAKLEQHFGAMLSLLTSTSRLRYGEPSITQLNDYCGHKAVCKVYELAIEEAHKRAI